MPRSGDGDEPLRATFRPLGYEPPVGSKQQNRGCKQGLKMMALQGCEKLIDGQFQGESSNWRFSGTRVGVGCLKKGRCETAFRLVKG